jgi:hypothetical protein
MIGRIDAAPRAIVVDAFALVNGDRRRPSVRPRSRAGPDAAAVAEASGGECEHRDRDGTGRAFAAVIG